MTSNRLIESIITSADVTTVCHGSRIQKVPAKALWGSVLSSGLRPGPGQDVIIGFLMREVKHEL